MLPFLVAAMQGKRPGWRKLMADGLWRESEKPKIGDERLEPGEPTGVNALKAATISQSFRHLLEAIVVFLIDLKMIKQHS